MKIVKAENLTFSYGGKNPRTALDAVSLEIEKGEFAAVLGKNDSGKTSLLRLISGIETAQRGKLTVCGFDVSYSNNIPAIRKGCAIIFSEPDRHFVRERVDEEIVYSLACRGIACTAEILAAAKKRARLHANGKAHISHLSSLQKICLCLACAIAGEPELLLVDDVFCELGYNERMRLMGILSSLNRHGMTIVLAGFDVQLASIAQRIILLSEGKIIADGKTREILENKALLEGAEIAQSFAMRCYFDLLEADIKLDNMPFTIDELVKEVCK